MVGVRPAAGGPHPSVTRLQIDGPGIDGGTAGLELLRGLRDWLGDALGVGLPIELFQAVAVVAVLLASYYAGRFLTRLFGRRIARRFRRPSVSRTILRLVRLAGVLVGGVVAANFLGIQLGNIVLSVTVFSAVVGIVLAPIIGTIINGVFVLADEPYEVGDMIELVDRGQTGFVEDVTLRYTKIFTLDNTFLVVPNGTMRDRDVINYSAEDTRTRLALDVTVTYEGDLQEARSLIEAAATSVDNVIAGGPDIRIGSARYPASPTCYIDSFGDHGVVLRLRYWVREPYKLLAARSKVQTAVWDRLEGADVEIAYPHSHVVFDDTSGQLSVAVDEAGRPRPGADRPDPGGVDVDAGDARGRE